MESTEKDEKLLKYFFFHACRGSTLENFGKSQFLIGCL
jgi:hypothetical protein